MRHGVDGRKFGRNTPHRKAMLRNLANSVILKEQVITTSHKAKEVRRVVDRLITIAKNAKPQAQRLAFDRSRDKEVVKKLFGELAGRYGKRAGGYTRVMRLSDRRRGDAAEMAVLELVDHPVLNRKKPVEEDKDSKSSSTSKKAAPAKASAKKTESKKAESSRKSETKKKATADTKKKKA